MSFYYLTKDLTVYKSVGARKVKRLFKYEYKPFAKVVPQFLKDIKVQIPTIRKVFPSLITNEIITVQPMSAPIGTLFNASGIVFAPYIPIMTTQGARRSQRRRPMRRNTIPTSIFKKQSKIICQSKHFYDVVTELLMHELEN